MTTITPASKPLYDYKHIWKIIESYPAFKQKYPLKTLIFQIPPYYFAFGEDVRHIINANKFEDEPPYTANPPLSEPLILGREDMARQLNLSEETYNFPIKILAVPRDRG
jgi:hypothetical protein